MEPKELNSTFRGVSDMNVGLPLPVDEASQLAARTIFSTREIQSLYKRFKELDISGNNILEYEVYILELASSFFNLEVLLASTLLVLGFLQLTLNFHLSFLGHLMKIRINHLTIKELVCKKYI